MPGSNVNIKIAADARQAIAELNRTGRSIHSLDKTGSRVTSGLTRALGVGLRAGAVAAGAGLVGLGIAAHRGWGELQDTQKVAAQTGAVLKSTGGAAGVTGKQISDLATKLSLMSGVDDEVVQSMENILLTFPKVTNAAGENNDIFNQATQITLDMSTALGKDLNSSAIQVGKALQDPIKGVTALRRVGVAFSQKQQDMIKRLEETGHHLDAQKLILRELNKEFAGSAKAAGDTVPGALAKANNAFDEAAGKLTARLLPAITEVVGGLTDIVDFTAKLAGAKSIDVAVELLVNAGGKVYHSISEALFGGGRTLTKDPHGRTIAVDIDTKGIVGRLADALKGADWKAIGSSVGTGLAAGITFTSQQINSIIGKLVDGIAANSDKIAEAGATIALKIVETLLDPSFWARNWKTVASIALAVVPVGRFLAIGRLLGSGLGRGLLELFLRFAARLPAGAQRFIGAVYRIGSGFFARLGDRAFSYIQEALSRLPGVAGRAFGLVLRVGAKVFSTIQQAGLRAFTAIGRRIDGVGSTIGRIALRFLGWVTALSGVQTAIQFVIDKVHDLINAISNINWPSPPGWLSGLAGKIPGIATGGTVLRSGFAIVGERGPEMLTLPRGARVSNAQDTARRLQGGNTYNQTFIIKSNVRNPTVAAADIGRQMLRAGLAR